VQIEEIRARTRGDERNATGAKDQRRREKRRTRETRRVDKPGNPSFHRFRYPFIAVHTETYEKRSEAQIATLLEKVETQTGKKRPARLKGGIRPMGA